MSDFQVRPATAFDISAILALLRRMHRDVAGMAPAYHAVAAADQVLRAITADLAFVAIAADSGRCIGSIGGVPMQQWFARSWCVQHLWWYVPPERRRSGAAVGLLEAFLAEAAAKPAPVYMSVSVADPRQDRAMRRLLRRHGLAAVGSTFWNGAKS